MIQHSSVQEFIKVTHHHDCETLISRDLELIQIIKIQNPIKYIPNFTAQLRESIRKIISEVASSNVIFWIHNKSYKIEYKKLNYSNIENSDFLTFTEDLWVSTNKLDNFFVTDLYITILYRIDAVLQNPLQKFFYLFNTKKLFDTYLDKINLSLQKINLISERILLSLENFKARKLGTIKSDQGLKSEIASFYYELINFVPQEYFIKEHDLSYETNIAKYFVGNNVINLVHNDQELFTAVFALKNINNLDEFTLDQILKLDLNLTISQILIPTTKTLPDNITKQYKYLQISSATKLAEIMGISKIQTESSKLLFEEQTLCIIFAHNLQDLNEHSNLLQNQFNQIGIIYVLEDVNLEKSFWSYVPSNISFINRKNLLLPTEIASLATMRTCQINQEYISPWGNKLITFRAVNKLLYDFHLYDQSNNNNSLILGSQGNNKTALTNLLLAKTKQFNPEIIYLSLNQNSYICSQMLGGKQIQLQNSINPFLIDDTPKSRKFLLEFFKIICLNYSSTLKEFEINIIENIIQYVFTLKPKKRILSQILSHISKQNKKYGPFIKKLEDNLKNQDYMSFFEGDNTNLQLALKCCIIDLSPLQIPQDQISDSSKINLLRALNAALIYAYFFYLSNTINKHKILVIDPLEKIIFLPTYHYIIEEIQKSSDVTFIALMSEYSKLTQQTSRSTKQQKNWNNLMKNFGTKIFFFIESKSFLYSYFIKQFDILSQFLSVASDNNKFLLIQNSYQLIINFDVWSHKLLSSILSSDSKERKILKLTQNTLQKNNNLNDLFKSFYEEFKKYNL